MAYALITPNGIKFVAFDNYDPWSKGAKDTRFWKPGKRMHPLLEKLPAPAVGGRWVIRRESASMAEIISKPHLEWYPEE